MSHEDAVIKLPKNFKSIAYTKDSNLQLLKIVKKKSMVFNFILKLHIQIMENKYLKTFYFQFVILKKNGMLHLRKIDLFKEIKKSC